MKLDEFCRKVLNKFSDSVTDQVFLMIQNDRELIKDYLALIAGGGQPHTINGELGKTIKSVFNLNNVGRCQHPQSPLIQSYERHVTNM